MFEYSVKKDETKLPAVFKIVPIKMGALSLAAGRDVWEDREFIYIHFPGGKTVHAREVTEEDKIKYAYEYEAFKKGIEGAHEGTLIEVLPGISPAQVENLKSLKVFTIQHLAQYPDGRLGDLGHGARELQKKANDYLKASDNAAYVVELKKQIADQQAQIDKLVDRIESMSSPKKKPAPTGVKKVKPDELA
jgi:hypothetical protein